MFGWYPWKACLFLQGNGRRVNVGEREVGAELGGEVGGGSVVWNIIYEGRINFKKLK